MMILVDRAAAAPPDPAQVNGLATAEVLLVAELAEIDVQGSNLASPPSAFGVVRFRGAEALRGPSIDEARFGGNPEELGWVAGQRYVVTASEDGGWLLHAMVPATSEALAAARAAAALPFGWRLDDAGVVDSPWTGDRPPWLTGDGIEFGATFLPVPGANEFRNPYGDGEFRVAVRNPTDHPVEVPALRCDAAGVRWADSLVVVGNTGVVPLSSAPLPPGTRAVVLAPGEGLSAVVDAFAIPGLVWRPNMSVRYYLTFGLGDRAATSFLYFSTRHHLPLVAARAGGVPVRAEGGGPRPECR